MTEPIAVETIEAGDRMLCYIYRGARLPDRTVFPSPPAAALQAGYIVYPRGHEIQRHVHKPIERHIVGTAEVLVVLQGRCEIDVYDDARTLVTTREMAQGDVMVMLAGGHGFRMLEDTVLLEVKQGPYTGPDEKERF